MAPAARIEKICTVTSKGQTTLPLAIRQLLGVPDGGRIRVRTEERRIVLEAVEEEHTDPAIGAFLAMMAADIAAGRVERLPDDLAGALRQALDDVEVDLDAPIEGDVCL
ncbi:type II toxin-antitoxin system PrlF family antitoxin [Rhodocista pekingensis]|uniref:Type II toxin-antitoxin system PrlF family antitoxin n=1 Tax=Rhodocista pekingensis TaxID=201185 RepID=A0ABW2KTZ0_9PROT